MTNIVEEVRRGRKDREVIYQGMINSLAENETDFNWSEVEGILSNVGKTVEDFEEDLAKAKRINELQAIVAEEEEVQGEKQTIGQARREEMEREQQAKQRLEQKAVASLVAFSAANGPLDSRLREIRAAKSELHQLIGDQKPSDQPYYQVMSFTPWDPAPQPEPSGPSSGPPPFMTTPEHGSNYAKYDQPEKES